MIKDQLKESNCELCTVALHEIIRLEASVISMEKMADRLRRPSNLLRGKIPSTAAGRALHKRVS